MGKQNLSQSQQRIWRTNRKYGRVTVSAIAHSPWLGAFRPEKSWRYTPEIDINERLLHHPTCHSTPGVNHMV